jgi:hypothetical protein
MTSDPIDPREPEEARPARKARGPMDPFERAARLEEQEELEREIKRARLLSKVTGKDSSIGAGLASLGFPWLIWGAIRAAYYDFGEPTLPRSIVAFFFDDFWWFGALTVLVLLLVWAALITRFTEDD